MSWRDRASCNTGEPPDPPDLFVNRKTHNQAALICEDCPVKIQCYAAAVHMPGVPHGTWGGEWFGR